MKDKFINMVSATLYFVLLLLKTQGYNTYLNLAKQRFKCLECNGTFTAKTSIVDGRVLSQDVLLKKL